MSTTPSEHTFCFGSVDTAAIPLAATARPLWLGSSLARFIEDCESRHQQRLAAEATLRAVDSEVTLTPTPSLDESTPDDVEWYSDRSANKPGMMLFDPTGEEFIGPLGWLTGRLKDLVRSYWHGPGYEIRGDMHTEACEFFHYVECDAETSQAALADVNNSKVTARSARGRPERVSTVAEAVATVKLEFGDMVRNEENLGSVRKRLVMLLRETDMRKTALVHHVDLAVEAVFVPSAARLRVVAITASAEVQKRRDVLKKGFSHHWRRSLPVYLASK